ncbi:MAG: hypothetical protein R6W31_17540 [Bacteroidales bacterium]
MRMIYQLAGLAGLVLVLLPSILFYLGVMEPEKMKSYIFLGTILWFAGAIPWLGRKIKET